MSAVEKRLETSAVLPVLMWVMLEPRLAASKKRRLSLKGAGSLLATDESPAKLKSYDPKSEPVVSGIDGPAPAPGQIDVHILGSIPVSVRYRPSQLKPVDVLKAALGELSATLNQDTTVWWVPCCTSRRTHSSPRRDQRLAFSGVDEKTQMLIGGLACHDH